MKPGDMVKDNHAAFLAPPRTGLIMRIDKDFFGSSVSGKKDRFLIYWTGVPSDDTTNWEYCKLQEFSVVGAANEVL